MRQASKSNLHALFCHTFRALSKYDAIIILRMEEWVVCKSHLRLTNSRIFVFYVKMNHFEVHLVSPKVADSKVLRMAIQLSIFFFLISRQNGKCNIRNFTQILFGMSPDELAFKVYILTSDLKF